MILSRLFGRKRNASQAIVIRTYEAIVATARQPYLFSHWHVPDTPIGRFESLSLHMILFLHRIKGGGIDVQALGQEVVEEFFQDVDHSLRELGIGDTSVPKRMKKLAKMFYGRAAAYDLALASADRDAFAKALERNIFPDGPQWEFAPALAHYALAAAKALGAQPDEDILGGGVTFPDASAMKE
ncbi:MAG: ubiquinol-cytochrome C chaperone family protein [Rhizobiaceae bacterium]